MGRESPVFTVQEVYLGQAVALPTPLLFVLVRAKWTLCLYRIFPSLFNPQALILHQALFVL